MKKYSAEFSGREKGAIGICHNIKTEIEGGNPEEAQENLYEKFEHIQNLKLIEKGGTA